MKEYSNDLKNHQKIKTIRKLYENDVRSLQNESYKVKGENNRNIYFPKEYLRCTKTKPKILYARNPFYDALADYRNFTAKRRRQSNGVINKATCKVKKSLDHIDVNSFENIEKSPKATCKVKIFLHNIEDIISFEGIKGETTFITSQDESAVSNLSPHTPDYPPPKSHYNDWEEQTEIESKLSMKLLTPEPSPIKSLSPVSIENLETSDCATKNIQINSNLQFAPFSLHRKEQISSLHLLSTPESDFTESPKESSKVELLKIVDDPMSDASRSYNSKKRGYDNISRASPAESSGSSAIHRACPPNGFGESFRRYRSPDRSNNSKSFNRPVEGYRSSERAHGNNSWRHRNGGHDKSYFPNQQKRFRPSPDFNQYDRDRSPQCCSDDFNRLRQNSTLPYKSWSNRKCASTQTNSSCENFPIFGQMQVSSVKATLVSTLVKDNVSSVKFNVSSSPVSEQKCSDSDSNVAPSNANLPLDIHKKKTKTAEQLKLATKKKINRELKRIEKQLRKDELKKEIEQCLATGFEFDEECTTKLRKLNMGDSDFYSKEIVAKWQKSRIVTLKKSVSLKKEPDEEVIPPAIPPPPTGSPPKHLPQPKIKDVHSIFQDIPGVNREPIMHTFHDSLLLQFIDSPINGFGISPATN